MYVCIYVHRRDGKFHHCRISTKADGGRTKYFLINQMCFDSIFDLVEYYMANPLKSPMFEQVKLRRGGRQNYILYLVLLWWGAGKIYCGGGGQNL